MKRSLSLFVAAFILSASAAAKEPARTVDQKAMELLKKAVPKLTLLAAQKDIVAEVVKRNAEAQTDAAAKAFQVRWLSSDPADIEACKPYLENPGSLALKAAMADLGVTKAFSMDKRGNIASTVPKAHDYLHGQQEKFQECFKSGKPVVNKPTKDLTSKKFSVQISVPILFQGKTVGVLLGTYSLE